MFRDRRDAGRQLGGRLEALIAGDVVVLGLPRGGVPVAYEVASALDAPLDVIVVRKLGVPFQPELGMGAIGEGGARVINAEVMSMARVTDGELAEVEARERSELERRALRFRQGRKRLELTGRTALIIDDGVATGSTARAACQVARAQGAARVVVAVPVAPSDAASRFANDADEFIALQMPSPFFGVGQFYRNFAQTADEEVVELLTATRATDEGPGDNSVARSDLGARTEEVEVGVDGLTLAGFLDIPDHATGMVVFAHGSGSSRHSGRNRYVASVLNQAGLGTLVFDLLTDPEAADRRNVFDVELLAGRLVQVTGWLRDELGEAGVPVGLFGASTGAAAALWAATDPACEVAAVVSRGGRPDLARPRLDSVLAPTRLIVGGADTVVLDLNRQAQRSLTCENDLVVVPGATHLFEEPGALEQAARLACEWFLHHL
ncbi:MAG: phosphoribosyltransferase [Actinomycetia bacterium]|nr:phosphoribosyltransferase [Actinomycetes bacterium]